MDDWLRLPREPYPGLRPYQDFEAPLLFGRDRQVGDIVSRLAATQFVAVLGGSGSGKSSLMIAGVVPRLRSYGISDAGDLWLPMTCTPGTNAEATNVIRYDPAADAPSDEQSLRSAAPLTRLAQRFTALLKSRGTAEADAAREGDIAAVLRQEMGLARLLDAYTPELAVDHGLDAADARVLIVLDQFEEVFHATNRTVADASALVQCVMDHCVNPHPRCHVVLTMRSEFLNNCAAYLELPDAINQSAYLVRRLGPDELRAVIAGPAQRFLRLLTRSATPHDAQALPEQVRFEPELVERLLGDVSAIADDPDHLPLLQHALARVWQAALARIGSAQPVPALITMVDLECAVNVHAAGSDTELQPELNVLRACIENWPEAIFLRHTEDQRLQLQRLIPRLAIKDINTGTYTQQRLNVDDGARLLGTGKTRADLRELISDEFLGSVDYFLWDDSDPRSTTLKVSHESLIRGWLRFRDLVDTELAQFEEYLAVLRKCADWVSRQRRDDFLLGTSDLRRLGAIGFVGRMKDRDRCETWARLLRMDRHAVHLAQVAGEMDAFLQASEQRLEQRRLRETRGRRSARALVAITVAFALLPTTLFSWLVQGPTMRRAELLFEAGNRANQALLSPSQEAVGDGAGTLQSMLMAGALVDQARSGDGPWRTQVSKELLERVGNWPLFSDQRDFLDHVFMQAEPPVNGTLRQLMQGAVWQAPAAGSRDAADEVQLMAPTVIERASCVYEGRDVSKGSVRPTHAEPGAVRVEAPTGRLFVQWRADSKDIRPLRALFVLDRDPSYSRSSLEVFSASVSPDTRVCLLGAGVLSSPEQLNTSVVFDASLQLFFYTVDGFGSQPPSLIVQELDWERSSDGVVHAWQRQTLTSITDSRALLAVKATAGANRAAVVPTYRATGGRMVDIGGRRWFVLNSVAQRIDPDTEKATNLVPLLSAAAGSACEVLARAFAPAPGFRIQVFEQGDHCFRIQRGWPSASPGESTVRPLRDDVRVSMHEKPSAQMLQRANENPPAPLAAMLPFARVAPSPSADAASWWVGTSGPLSGWLVMKTESAAGTATAGSSAPILVGAPWSTCALWRVGRQILRHNPSPTAKGTTAATLNTACPEH